MFRWPVGVPGGCVNLVRATFPVPSTSMAHTLTVVPCICGYAPFKPHSDTAVPRPPGRGIVYKAIDNKWHTLNTRHVIFTLNDNF